jgi:SpoVK/Ycf46/Vps4 family AAA+-type ATPase
MNRDVWKFSRFMPELLQNMVISVSAWIVEGQGITHTVWCGIVDYEAIVKLSDGFNGADLRNVCTESGKYFIMDRLPILTVPVA